MNEASLSRLTAVLASAPGLPVGDTRCGLEVELRLDLRGQILPPFPEDSPWRVRRFWPDREDWLGVLVPVEDGWGVRSAGGDDEPIWELHGRGLRPGEYITLVRPTEGEFMFRIVNVEALA